MLVQPPASSLSRPVRIVIADDHPIYLNGLAQFIQSHAHLHLAGSAVDGEQLVAVVAQVQPDVVITNVNMPVKNGIEATAEIKKRFPFIRVIGLSASDHDDHITGMMEAGALGYLLKHEEPGSILLAIESVMAGKPHYNPAVANRLVWLAQRTESYPTKPFDRVVFTNLEKQVLIQLCLVYKNRAIAEALGIKQNAVRAAKQRIAAKIGCDHCIAMSLYAVRFYIARLW